MFWDFRLTNTITAEPFKFETEDTVQALLLFLQDIEPMSTEPTTLLLGALPAADHFNVSRPIAASSLLAAVLQNAQQYFLQPAQANIYRALTPHKPSTWILVSKGQRSFIRY